MKRLLQAAILLAVSVPAILAVCWRTDVTMADYQTLPTATAPADSSRRRGPVEDPTLRLRKDLLDNGARAEGQELLRRMRLQWKLNREQQLKNQAEGRLGCGWRPPGRFVWESMSDNTETRLFAFGYPELAETWAKGAESPETPDWERAHAEVALGWLWQAGWSSAGESLARIARATESDAWSYAVYLLADGDREGRYRALYRDLARNGDQEAIEALSFWHDPAAIEILTEALDKWKNLPAPRGMNGSVAREVLPRVRGLGSDAWIAMAKQAILEEPGPKWRGNIAWALRLASERRAPWLEEVLRARMKKAYGESAVNFSHYQTKDDAYDDVLLTLARIGGTLTQNEYNYLYYYGYSCDPRQRLVDVLREKNYAR